MQIIRMMALLAALCSILCTLAVAAPVSGAGKSVEYVYSVALADGDIKSGRITLVIGKPATVTRYNAAGDPLFQIRLLASDSGAVERSKELSTARHHLVTIEHTVFAQINGAWTEQSAQFTYISGKKGSIERFGADGKTTLSIEGTATIVDVTPAEINDVSKSAT